MTKFYSTILITVFATTFTSTSCHYNGNSDEKDKALTEKESELLKKENELLKKEQELNQKSSASTTEYYAINQPNNSSSNNLDFLKELNGKYPYEVNLFENEAFNQRLKNLLGNKSYNFLKETWSIESPIEFSDNIFVASGCQEHNCGFTNFIIVVDFSKNIMYAGIREEDYVETYSEDGGNSPKVKAWENGF